jgi:flagellar protein FliO/FliZ
MQDLLVNWFGSTGASVIKYVIAFAVIAGLLLLLRWVLQNSLGGGALSAFKGRQNRLAVVDAVAVDPKRRLVLVRRDNVEHLILVGGGNDLVVEPTIIRGVPVGSLGRSGLRSSAPSAAGTDDAPQPEQVAPVAQATPVEPIVAPAPVVSARISETPVVRQPPLRTTSVERGPAAAVRQKLAPQRAQVPVSEPIAAPVAAYVPPEPERVETLASPIAAIVPEPESPTLPPERSAPPATDASSAFDDLARHLDEALKNDLGDIGAPVEPMPAPAPVRVQAPEIAPAVRPTAVSPEPKVESRSQPTASKPVIPAASAWLRPRTSPVAAKPAEPKAVEPQPTEARAVEPRVAEPRPAERVFSPRPAPAPIERRPRVAPATVAPAAIEPSAPGLDEGLAQALETSLTAREPVARPLPAEPIVPVAPPVELQPAAAPAKADTPEFSSLEDEMARLLDELAGDSKGKR